MKPTREELERWADPSDAKLWLTGEAAACLKRAARLALDLMDENERLASANRVLVGEEHTLRCEVAALARSIGQPAKPAPSPLLDDSIRQAVVDSADVLRSLAARDEDRHWHLRGDSFAAGLVEGVKYWIERGALSNALLDDRLWRRVFAGQAMAGAIASPTHDFDDSCLYWCVDRANALLAELRRREGGA